jgi:hypothetical protein
MKINMHCRNQHGIALLPLILMVVVFGALVGVGMGVVKQRVEKAQQIKTAENMTAAVRSISAWTMLNGSLPQWGDNTPDTVVDEFTEIVKQPEDAWQQDLIYSYASDLGPGMPGDICGKTATAIPGSGTDAIAFLITSPGPDRITNTLPGTPGAYTGPVTLSSDDISKVVTLVQLQNAIGCFGIVQGRLILLNDDLPNACMGQAYEAALYAEGGVPLPAPPFYNWSHTITAPWLTGITPRNRHLTLQGTPSALGTEIFDVSVSDRESTAFQRRYSVTVIDCGNAPQPVSEWEFNEGSGSAVNDTAGSNDGTLQGGTSWDSDTAKGSGSSLRFDGAGDYVRVPDNISLQIDGELTLRAWAKETQSRRYAKLISRRSGSYFYFIGVDQGRPYGGIGDGSAYQVTGKSLLMSLNRWNHLAFAYNDDLDSMYLHFAGTERPSQVLQDLPPRAGIDLSIGADSQGSSNFFIGAIDDVAIYDTALSSTAIRQLYDNHSHPNLAASYYFSGDASDAGSSGLDGTISGAAWTDDRFDNPGQALHFDGNDFVRVADHPRLRLDRALTITAWIKETTRRRYAKILSRRTGRYFYFLGVDNGHPYGGVGDGSNFTVTRKSIDMPLGQWHFLAFVYDSQTDQMHIYYDGILDQTTVLTSLPPMTGVDLTIGADAEGSRHYFEGLIDEVALYDQALTADEIRQTY